MAQTYDPRCVRCRYARPGDTTTHEEHETDPYAEVTTLKDGTLRIVGKDRGAVATLHALVAGAVLSLVVIVAPYAADVFATTTGGI